MMVWDWWCEEAGVVYFVKAAEEKVRPTGAPRAPTLFGALSL